MVKKIILPFTLVLILLFPVLSYSFDVEFPLVQSFSYFPYLQNEMLENGSDDLFLDIGYSNVYMFNFGRDIVNDFETGTVTIGYRRSILKNLNVEFYLRSGIIYGGVMDKLIEDFHKLIGNGEDGRGEYPRNTVNFQYKDVFSYNRSIVFAGPFIAGVMTRVYSGKNIDINFRVSLGIPLHENKGISSGNPFATTGFVFLYKKKGLNVDISLYGSFFKIPEWYDPSEVRSRMFFFNLHSAYKKIFGGFLFRSTPFRESDLSNPAFQVYFGYRINKMISISMYEEIPPMDTVSDVSFRLIFKF